MRIERLDLLSYGPFHDVSLDLAEASAGLTVLVGPNEAGKSTALRALCSVLYGFARATADDFGLGRASLKLGVRLRGVDGSEYNLVRRATSRPPLVDAEGAPVDEATLVALLGNTDRALFTSLFTINHEELHNGSQDLLDAEGELGRLVFSASLGGGSLRAVVSHLETRATKLFSPRGRLQTIPESLGRFRALRAQVRDLQARSREWERRRQAREEAEANLKAVGAEVRAARAEHARLVRLRASLPLLATRTDAITRLHELEAAGTVQPESWAARCAELLAATAEAVVRRDEQAAALERLETQLGGVDVPTELLDAAERIDRLQQGLGRYRKDSEDLPLREGELAADTATIASLLERLGLTADEAAGVTSAQLATVTQLADRYGAVDSAASAAAKELRDIDDQVQVLADEAHRLRQPLDVGQLRRRTEAAQSAAAVMADLAGETAELESLHGDLGAGLIRLGLAPDTDIEALVAPTSAAVQGHTDRRAALVEQITGLEARIEEHRVELERIEVEQSAVAEAPGVPDPDALRVAREWRRQGWQLVKAAWLEGRLDEIEVDAWSGGASLPDAYEAAVAAADEAADVRFDQAAQVQQLIELARRSEDTSGKRDRVGDELEAKRGELGSLDGAWTTLWTEAGFTPVDPAAAAGRLEEISRLQALAAHLRRRRSALTEREASAAAHRQAVGDALRSLGTEPGDEDLLVLLSQARELIDAEAKAASYRADLERRILEAEQSRAARAKALKVATDELQAWKVAWSASLLAIHLPPGATVEVARGVVFDLGELRTARQSAEGLRRRVEGIRRDIGRFEGATRSLLEELTPGIVGRDLLDGLAQVKRLLDDARERQARRRALEEQLQAARDSHAEAEHVAEELAGRLAIQRQAEGIGPDEPLDAHIERARAAAHQRARLEDAETKLLEQGAGRTVAVLAAEAEAYDGDVVRVDAAIVEWSERIDELEEGHGAARDVLNDARRAFEEIDGSDRAANVEQDAEVELAGLANAVNTYARVAVAGELLGHVIAAYGREHQDPIVGRAIALFSELTNSAFSGLVVDVGGERRLQACRRNGQFHDLDELSDGTLDQLYLALRLAGIEHHLDRVAEPVPVVLDDLLVNFDDDRARAAIRVLAELGRRTQVLLFTHHRHIVDLAKDQLDTCALGVVELAARDHDAAAPVAEFPGRAKRASRAAAGEMEHDGDARRVLAVLRDADEPLARAQIVERSGMGGASWTQTIRLLVDSGAVIQTGTKRGARYQLR